MRAAHAGGGDAAAAGRARRGAAAVRRQGARARRLRRLPRAVGRPTAPPAPTTTPAPRWCCSTTLLDRFGVAYAAAKAARAAVDFEDLELRVRDLLAADAALRARWAERFALIMVDEFQDTNRLQLDAARGARARQPLRRRRRGAVDLRLPSCRRRHLPRPPGGARARRACAASRSTSARGPRSSTSSTPRSRRCSARASRRSSPAAGPTSCACSRPTRRRSRASSCSPARRSGWEEREGELGLAGLAAQPWRRAEARAVAARLRAEVDDAGRALRRPRRARARDELAAPLRAGAGGAGPAHVRRRRPRLLVAGAGPRRHRLPLAAGQPARRGGALRDALVAVLRCGHRRAGAARRGRPQRGGEGAWAALRRAAAAPPRGSDVARRPARPTRPSGSWRSRASPPASGCAPSGCRSRCCSSARSPPPATTSRSSRAPAATAGSRTCAS